MSEYKRIKGEEIPVLLDKINVYLDQENIDVAEFFLDLVQKELPDNPDVERETKNRLDELYHWFKVKSEPYNRILDSNNHLERFDAQNELKRLRFIRAYREFKIYKRIVSMFRISENNSIVDYEL